MSNKIARISVDPVSEVSKVYGRTVARVQVASAVWALWDRLRREHGVDQQWLADRMGKDKSWVSRLLKGPGNWTLDTVGEILEAMGGRITLVEAHTYDEISQGKAARKPHSGGARLILTIEAEVVIDDPEHPDLVDITSLPLGSIGKLHRFAGLIEEKVEAA
jgi:transcriptional regulator with XRE-family HTH domain